MLEVTVPVFRRNRVGAAPNPARTGTEVFAACLLSVVFRKSANCLPTGRAAMWQAPRTKDLRLKPDTTVSWSWSLFPAARAMRTNMSVALSCCIATACTDPISLNPVLRRPLFLFSL